VRKLQTAMSIVKWIHNTDPKVGNTTRNHKNPSRYGHMHYLHINWVISKKCHSILTWYNLSKGPNNGRRFGRTTHESGANPYQKFLSVENGRSTMYVMLKKALYGTLQVAMLFWKTFTAKHRFCGQSIW